MIGTVMGTLLRQRLNSPMRMILAAVFFGGGLIAVLLTGSLGGLTRAQMSAFGFLTAAGLIGQEVSSGVLTLAFARPLRRADWVIGRWLGASALAGSLIALQVLLAVAIVTLRHVGHVTLLGVAATLLDGLLAATGLCAVLLLFSSLAPGLGDLAMLLLATILAQGLGAVGSHYQLGWLVRAGTELQGFLSCSLEVGPLFGMGAVSWFSLVSYVSTIAICLVVAIHAVNRKELSYASG